MVTIQGPAAACHPAPATTAGGSQAQELSKPFLLGNGAAWVSLQTALQVSDDTVRPQEAQEVP